VRVFKGWFGDEPDNFTGIVESENGDRAWCLNGECHRVDGPAIEWGDSGSWSWYLNGVMITEEEHTKKTAGYRTTLGKLIFNEHFKLEEK
jgi:hypothetical protein